MTTDTRPPFAKGSTLLAYTHPTGGPKNAYLHPTGGQATDGGRRSGGGASPLVVEAVRRSCAGLVRSHDGPARRPVPATSQAPGAAGKTKPINPQEALPRYEPWVRVQTALSRLQAGVLVDGLTVQRRGAGGLKKNTLLTLVLPMTPNGRIKLLEGQASRVRQAGRRREDQYAEIMVQADELWPFFSAVVDLDAARAPHVFEYLQLGLSLVTAVVMPLKYAASVARPSEVSALVLPMLDVPGHAALPSGHASAARMLCELLVALLPSETGAHPLLRRLALRVGRNREVAGLHYPIDTAAGWLLGETLAGYLLNVSGAAGQKFLNARLDLTRATSGNLEQLSDDEALLQSTPMSFLTTPQSDSVAPQPDDVVAWMFERARTELSALGRG